MKQVLSFISIAAFLAACSGNPKTGVDKYVVDADKEKETPTVVVDTFGLAEFQEWKAQNELAEANAYGQQSELAPVAAAPVAKSAATRKTAARSTARTGTTRNSGAASSETAHTAKAPEKKGWSKAAKGTAIGAGSGAVVGAVINKRNRTVGGVVGGVVGGAVGYGVGRAKDKKDGRY